MRNICWAFLWLFLPFNTLADTWRLTVTAKPVTDLSSVYEYSIKVAGWDFSSQTPNPLYNCINKEGQCRYAIGYMHTHSSGGSLRDSEKNRMPHASSAETIGELGENIMTKDSYWWNRTFLSRKPNPQTCFYVAYMINGGGHLQLPGGSCTYADLPPTVCSIEEPSIELSHLVNQEQNSGLVATGQLSVSCTENMKVRIVGKYNSDEIMLDKKRNFKSLITVNNQPFSKGAVITATPYGTTVNIKSTLKGSAPAGEYQGSAVIIVAPE
ncbi:hypothetical protein [Providencia alcalifaciens]|uniref:MrpH family fimbial adhesin n=1 Tax=Providencia alcalifaciens TaxID=126385 RepID=UPI002B05B792|nr:hypothetical protein [Providencia alcalifaciens]